MIGNSPADLKQRVLAVVRRTPSAVRADARSDARAIFATAAALSMALFLGFDGVSHSAGRAPWMLVLTIATWLAVAVLAGRGAWRWGGSFATGSTMQLATIAVGTPALLMAVSLALARLAPSASVAASGLPCVALTFAAALYPLAGVFVLRRESDPMHPTAAGAALGAASGAAAGVMVRGWCPVTDAAHVLSAHVLPVAALAVAGAITGDRILAIRNKAIIANAFVSCDVALVGDRVAGDRTRSGRTRLRRGRRRVS
jgi:hypothetical protein